MKRPGHYSYDAWAVPAQRWHWAGELSPAGSDGARAMLIVGVALASLIVFAPLFQATPVPPEETTIPPIVWELVEMTAEGDKPAEIAEPSRYTVQFLPEGQLAIGADCNRVTGTYEIENGALEIKLGASTLALCPPDTQAEPFQGVLAKVSSFAFDEHGHLLLEGSGGSLRLRPTVEDVVWEWHEFTGMDDSIVKPKNPEDYSITFLPEGKLVIKADCNRARGAYTIDGAIIDLRVGGTTKMACPEGTLMNEFLRDLDEVSSFVFRNGNLYLALPVDAGILTLYARYEAPAAATPEAG